MMATHVGTTGAGGVARHFTLVSLDLGRFRAIRARRYFAWAALSAALVATAVVIGAALAYFGAPLWLAVAIGVCCAGLIPARSAAAGHGRAGAA